VELRHFDYINRVITILVITLSVITITVIAFTALLKKSNLLKTKTFGPKNLVLCDQSFFYRLNSNIFFRDPRDNSDMFLIITTRNINNN
jgi:hypothetical protein